jgi:hypothetical protein
VAAGREPAGDLVGSETQPVRQEAVLVRDRARLAARLAHLLPSRTPGQGGTPPLCLEVRLDAVAAVLLDGLSYRRVGRVVGISKTEVGEAVCVDGLATRVQRPRGWATQKVLYDAKRHTHTAQGLAVSTVWGDLLWLDGG